MLERPMRGTAAAATDAVFARNRVESRVALTVARTAGRSRRQRIYEDGSLRLRFPNRENEDLDAVIVNTAGGVAGGDRIAFDIALETDAALTVTTAAAEKIYRTHGPAAEIDLTIRAAPGATLRWLPQETILFDGARLTRRIDVALAANACLLLAEAMVFGRAAMDESVRHGALFDRWRVRRDGRLIFADALRLDDAPAARLGARATAAGGNAAATVLMVSSEGAENDAAHVDRVRAQQDLYAGDVGASAWDGIVLLRLVAPDGARLRRDLVLALSALDPRPLPRLWLN